MTPHIEAQHGDYNETVLMPGDPLRAKYIAETFFDDAVCVNTVRNCFGFSGTYKGKPVSVQASGMGQPSLGIYVHELYTNYDVKQIIRVGSCGGIDPDLKLGDIVVALTASTDSAMTRNLVDRFLLSPVCDFELARNYLEVDPDARVGSITSNDYFYQPDESWYKNMAEFGILGVEMETHLLYTLSMKHRKKALSVNTVSDHLITGEHLTSKQREVGFDKMITNVLESLL